MCPRPPGSALLPYTTLFRSQQRRAPHARAVVLPESGQFGQQRRQRGRGLVRGVGRGDGGDIGQQVRRSGSLGGGRKSTRLNSSHLGISYAVFCLEKKTPEPV